jgi:hypothetical protein
MTERQWLASADPAALLAALRERIEWPRRKWRHFALACLEPFRPHFPHSGDFSAVLEMIAHDAEGEWTFEEADRAQQGAVRILQLVVEDASEQRWHYVAQALGDALLMAVHGKTATYFVAAGCQTAAGYLATGEWEERRQVALVHEIFGNPFRPVALDPLWLTTDVLALARGIYDERAFDRMPILADALQDAGCDNDDVLRHCRDAKQTHVRGCWALDLLLNK